MVVAILFSPAVAQLDLPALLRETGALLSGHFRLSSGLHSPNYVQCAKLLEHPRHARAIGEALAEKVRAMNAQKIVAPALGGVIIGFAVAEALDVPSIFTERKEGAMTLRRGFGIDDGERVVIVEDVVTTGKSTRETAKVIEEHGGVVSGFASILNRSGKENPFDAPYESLLALALDTYEEAACPLCKSGVAIDSPGSRYSR
jgi:orotate phosphoribosyltransferase